MARIGRILGAIAGGAVGFAVGGPAGAYLGAGASGALIGGVLGASQGNAIDESRRGKAELKKQEGAQTAEYDRQRSRIREESDRIGKQLESSKNKIQAGVARGARSRIRGGIFGDQQPTPGLGQRLG